jgi:hypothetical protein
LKPLKLSLVLQLLVIFASGAVVGALGHRFYGRQQARSTTVERPRVGGRGGGEIRRGYTEFMRSRLKLRDDQVRKLNEIYDDTDHRFAELRKRTDADPAVKEGFATMRRIMDPETQVIGKDQSAKILTMLDPGQRAEYEKILKERAANPKRRGGRPEGSPPPDRRGGRSEGFPPPERRP